MSTTTGTIPGIRIVDMPDLGTVTDDSSVVGEHAGSGRFSAIALRTYVGVQQGNVGRNLVLNPTFTVAQRGAGPWTTSGNYTADRWQILMSGSTLSALVFVLSDADRINLGDEAAQSALQSVVGGTAGADDLAFVYQALENVRRFAGKTLTLSFWAKATSGTPKVGLNWSQNFGSGGGVGVSGAAQAITLSTTWTRYTATFSVPSVAGKTFGTAGTDTFGIYFWQSSGATDNAHAGGIGVQSYALHLWGVQLEVGPVATPLDYGGTPQQQLAQCQRFACLLTVGAQLGGPGPASGAIQIPFPVQMRATPTVANISPGFINNASVTQEAAQDNRSMLLQIDTTVSNGYVLNRVNLYSADL